MHLPPGGPLSGMAADVRAGLTSPFKELSPRYFYDERGSELFEQITELPEYYPTRCERAILEARSAEIVRGGRQPGDADRARLGLGRQDAGAARRDARRRLPARPTRPVDISEEITRDTAERDRRGVRGHRRRTAWSATSSATSSGSRSSGPRVIALLGGTIGNFEPAQRASFLRRVANLLDPEDRFLLGTDLVKDRATLEAAYNDSQGVTAEFNKNVLDVLNRELGADFDLDAFEHVARWDDENLWVDIRLRSLARPGGRLRRRSTCSSPSSAGEEMRTEISTKFARQGLEGIYAEAGLELDRLVDRPRRAVRVSLARAA